MLKLSYDGSHLGFMIDKKSNLNGHSLQETFLPSYNFITMKGSKKIYDISEGIIGLVAILNFKWN